MRFFPVCKRLDEVDIKPWLKIFKYQAFFHDLNFWSIDKSVSARAELSVSERPQSKIVGAS